MSKKIQIGLFDPIVCIIHIFRLCIMHTIGSNSPAWPLITFYDQIWISISDKILSRKICIFDVFRPTGPILPLLNGFDPSLTSDDPNWPWKYSIWIFEKILSRNICILDIIRLIRPFWPQFDDLTQVWPMFTFNRPCCRQIRNW